MSFRLLDHLESSHYHPQFDVGGSSREDILELLKKSGDKRSLVLCCSNISSLLDGIHNMSQVLEIYVCEKHCSSQLDVLQLRNYPKVKLISLDDPNSGWKSSAHHAIAAVCSTEDQYVDHYNAMKDALKAAMENSSDGVATENPPDGVATKNPSDEVVAENPSDGATINKNQNG
jgi:hypothetical protein